MIHTSEITAHQRLSCCPQFLSPPSIAKIASIAEIENPNLLKHHEKLCQHISFNRGVKTRRRKIKSF
jgi:hypothetical protein